MQISIGELYNVIFQRHSRRQFNGMALSPQNKVDLQNLSQLLNSDVLGARVILVTENPDKVFKGAIGSYGKIKGAPAYVAFVGNMNDAAVQEKVGYLGELFILAATSMGLATCWVGGFFRPEVVQTQIQLNQGEQVLAVSPIGSVRERYSIEEKIMSGFVTSHKRKDLPTLCLRLPKDPIPVWIRSSLEVARLAPSAVNRQPWRFSVENETIKISVDNSKKSYNISKRLDCGIAMAHIEIGANHEGVIGRWEYLKGLDVARFKPV